MDVSVNSKEALKTLRDMLGEETYRQVLEKMAGVTVYFPTASSNADWMDKEQRNISLKEDFPAPGRCGPPAPSPGSPRNS